MTQQSATDICERIYAGFLGKAIGVRLGAPVEPTIWTYERIRDTFGEITQYLRDFKNFAADDDTNGPIYFVRALRDYGLDASVEDIGRTWLNYAAEEHGMFWWGGFGISTEHTAYRNLQAGIPAPRSGSIDQNGATVAEQIGGQIFIDSWGWVNPGDPARAARMAAVAASVAHDGEGLNGARFVAGAIASAFDADSIDAVIEAGLAQVPTQSKYAGVASAVLAFHQGHPDDWRACRDMLAGEWGYDRYAGACHIIPNAGVLLMALAYGRGELCRTVEIATMTGWDTDCNAGNAGAIVGTFEGVQPAWAKYREPINDCIVASGVAGTLNIVDVPTFARELSVLALRLRHEEVPALLAEDTERRGIRFDFDLPGATHGFRTEPVNQISLRTNRERPVQGSRGSLEILLDRLERGQGGRIFWKPFYRRTDFDDERYAPMFTPLVDDGQTVSFKLLLEPWNGDGDLRVTPYVRRVGGAIETAGGWTVPAGDDWQEFNFGIADGHGQAIDEVGLLVEYFGRQKFLGRLFLADFRIGGRGRTVINPTLESEEWGGVTRFTRNRGRWTLDEGRIHAHTATDADAWTGHYYTRDAAVSATLTPLAGTSHLVVVRAQGTSRFYAAGFLDGEAVILKEDFGNTMLARAPFPIEIGRDYELRLTVVGDALALDIDGNRVVAAADSTLRYGMSGLRMSSAGRMSVARFEIEERA